ncbi:MULTISPECIES: HEPN domain-containing protein [unclassified Thioalkalivibrio]|uniref:ApeA N-terminal domain 1-containing protein n=1 Tax=unclassified Thioalkalivibrio TaxID=2621013 RepID=UPI0018C93B4F|nr:MULTISPECIES: HEPN domain-containing protein [unclassified Thioalkalivibrio]
MNTLSPPEIHGLFWLPGNEETKVSGKCLCTEDGSIELEILGTLSGKPIEQDDGTVPRILGVSSNGKFVTLDDCFYRKRNFSFPGIAVAQIHVHRMYIGAHFSAAEQVAFDAISFHSTALDEWIRYSPINVELRVGKNPGVSIDYQPPPSPKWPLKDGTIEFKFAWTAPSPGQFREAKVTQRTLIEWNFPEPKLVSQATSYIFKLADLASLACDRTLPIHSITGYRKDLTEEQGEKTKRTPIEIYMNLERSQEVDHARLSRPFVLFDFKAISETFSNAVQTWFDSYEKFDSAFNLYFATRAPRQLYLENRYLMLAQAVETLHRKMFTDVFYEKDEYAELSAAVMEGVPQKFQWWVQARLQYGNELSLRQRLKRLFSGHEEIFGGKSKVKYLISKIVTTRNYLTHYDESLKDLAASGSEMHNLCLALELLLQIHFCRMVGFSQDDVHQICSTSEAIAGKKREIEKNVAGDV